MDTTWRKNYLRYKSFFLNMLTQYRERSDWKAYLEILLSLATVSLFSVFALRPTILTIAELIGQIQEKKETLAKMDSKISNLSKAQSLYDREAPNINLLTESAVPRYPNPDIFARQIEALSTKYQTVFSSMSLGQALLKGTESTSDAVSQSGENPQEENGKFIKFSVTTKANLQEYQKLVNFLKEFENFRTPAKMKSLQMNVTSDTESKEKQLILLIEGELPYLHFEEVKK